MLKAEDYKQYETNLQRRLTLPKHYLSRWAYYEQNATSLEGVELEKAKTLYQTLGHLTEKERAFLADKYRAQFEKKYDNSRNFKLDEDIATEYGMTIGEYIKLRKGVELKFFHYMQNYVGSHVIY